MHPSDPDFVDVAIYTTRLLPMLVALALVSGASTIGCLAMAIRVTQTEFRLLQARGVPELMFDFYRAGAFCSVAFSGFCAACVRRPAVFSYAPVAFWLIFYLSLLAFLALRLQRLWRLRRDAGDAPALED